MYGILPFEWSWSDNFVCCFLSVTLIVNRLSEFSIEVVFCTLLQARNRLRSLMTFPSRTTVTTLLCCLAIIGQAPGWLHVAGSQHPHHAVFSTAENVGEPACTCPHDSTSDNNQDETCQLPSGKDSHESDHGECPDSCVLCHFLISPNGVGCQLSLIPSGDRYVETAIIVSDLAPYLQPLSVPLARGPPRLSA